MSFAVVVVGAQWGDEGKGKVVDCLAERADSVVRFQGGNNAGHTLVVDGEEQILHLVPSGALHTGTRCYVGNGVVVDPKTLLEEVELLQSQGYLPDDAFRISERAHLILEPHRRLDAARERQAGDGKIGTTGRGIGPAYEDRASRRGVRVADLLDDQVLGERLEALLSERNLLLEHYGFEPVDLAALHEECRGFAARLRPYVTDVAAAVHADLDAGRRVLFEGAQGALLDCDHGTFPFVTSSNTIAGAVCTGVGVGPGDLGAVLAIAKAYTTRVGAGPYPTELDDATGEALRSRGAEFGATTGRPRRCGWLDMVALRYALRRHGATGLAVTKLDVLGGFDEIKIAVGYRLDGATIDTIPPRVDQFARCEPVYETHGGWIEDISDARSLEDLPATTRAYLERVEALAGVPVQFVSVGPGRDQTLTLHEQFS